MYIARVCTPRNIKRTYIILYSWCAYDLKYNNARAIVQQQYRVGKEILCGTYVCRRSGRERDERRQKPLSIPIEQSHSRPFFTYIITCRRHTLDARIVYT